tara:strand:+ start:1277 stop:1954 length:678 start_codon:yes stop_codon:yes gene_type:complete
MAKKKKSIDNKMNGQEENSLVIIEPEELNPMELVSQRRKKIQRKKTPLSLVKRRPDGFDYVDEAYMREQLNVNYPGLWSWEDGEWEVKGEWVVASATLWITEVETGLRRGFYSIGSARIQFKRNKPHTLENMIDLDKNVASANTYAFKRAINRLCNIADDIYKKISRDNSLSKKERVKLIDFITNNTFADGIADKLKSRITSDKVNEDNLEEVWDFIEKQVKNKE